MFVKRICYPVQVLGPGNRVGIWLAGCNKRCPGCMSPELQTTSSSKNCSVAEIKDMLEKIPPTFDGITISGGEPFLQSEELCELITYITENFTDDIIVYTGFRLQELIDMNSLHINNVLSCISVLIDGEYIDNLNDGIGIRGSSNQQIHIFKKHEKYKDLHNQERRLQTFRYNGQILVIGIQ